MDKKYNMPFLLHSIVIVGKIPLWHARDETLRNMVLLENNMENNSTCDEKISFNECLISEQTQSAALGCWSFMIKT